MCIEPMHEQKSRKPEEAPDLPRGSVKDARCAVTGSALLAADFRSPGTGLYSQLEEYNLPDPQALFEIGFFRLNPQPFHTLAKVCMS